MYFKLIDGVIYKFRTSDDELIAVYYTLGEVLKSHWHSNEVTKKQLNDIAWQWNNQTK